MVIRFVKENIYFFTLVLFFSACKQKNTDTVFTLLSPGETGIHFENTIIENDSTNLILNEYLYNGGGVAVGDINNDGLVDIYFSGNQVSGSLYLNKGNRQFEDITGKANLRNHAWATGVNMVDINADGYLDIYVCVSGVHASQKKANLLFINNKDLTFTESAARYGIADTSYSTQAAFLDYDKDGDLDLYLLNHKLSNENPNLVRSKQVNGENRNTDKLYKNDGMYDGHPVFRDVSKESGITIEGYGLGVAVSDINGDGWPDIYVSNDYLSNDILYINNRNGTFTNKIDSILQHISYSAMGNDVADFNNDGLPDIITLDMMPEENYRQKTMHSIMSFDRFQMEQEKGYQAQYARNMLQLNNGFKKDGLPYFSEIGYFSGVNATDWSWSALFADFDNDGYKDLHITNGFVRDLTNGDFIMYRMQQYSNKLVSDKDFVQTLMQSLAQYPGVKKVNYLYRNNQDLTFSNTSKAWGFSQPSYSNGAAYADLDNDGDLDIITNNINQPAFVYENNLFPLKKDQSDSIHFLKINLKGDGLNTNGLGAKVIIWYGGKMQVVEQNPGRGFLSSVDHVLHFGLGKVSKIDSLFVRWNNGKYQVLREIATNQILLLEQKKALTTAEMNDTYLPWQYPGANRRKAAFEEVTEKYRINFKHQEENYVDFKSSPLLPQMYSQLGPGLAVGDMNGDGLEDFYVGNGFKHSGKLFFQQADGTFASRDITQEVKYEEDMGCLLFDADNDQDLDLYVVSGSSEFEINSKYFQDKLYKNDGKGNFTLDTNALPSTVSSGSCISGADFDRDGDIDLFVGGRILPGKYPFPARSYILRNDGGLFTDITSLVAPDLQLAGMVCTALWSDFDDDGYTDLILAGEWMAVTFFRNKNGKFHAWDADKGATIGPDKAQNPQENQPVGFWNSLNGGDFDNDGDTDYIAGNLGSNSLYKASRQQKVSIFAADFDRSITTDAIIGRFILGNNGQYEAYPAHSRDVLVPAMPALRNIFNTFDDYGKADLQAFLSKLPVQPELSLTVNELRTMYFENKGKGQFTSKPLPAQAQFAPVFGIICYDINQDGNLDVLLIGNSFTTDVMAGRYDASFGSCLLGDGKGNFIADSHSGFFVEGDGKALVQLTTKQGKPLFLATRNNNTLLAFEVKQKNRKPEAISLKSGDQQAHMLLENGKTRKVEFYSGSGYLSQSSRSLLLNDSVVSITVYDSKGNHRKIPVKP